MEVYEHYFNHVYSYDLVTLQECVKSLTAESTFFIHLPVSGHRHEGSGSDIVDSSTSESASWPLLPHSTPNLRVDRGRLLASDEASAPPVLEVGTNVTIDSKFEQFKGRVISVDNSVLIMEVVRTPGTGAMIHSGRSGHFTFKNPAAAFVVATMAIQKAMWQNHRRDALCGSSMRRSNLRKSSSCIWLIERADLDSAAFTVSSSDFPDDQAKISELTRTKIIERLRGHAEPKRFSLTSHISDRLRLLRDQQRMLADEAAILRDLNVTQLALDHFSQQWDCG